MKYVSIESQQIEKQFHVGDGNTVPLFVAPGKEDKYMALRHKRMIDTIKNESYKMGKALSTLIQKQMFVTIKKALNIEE